MWNTFKATLFSLVRRRELFIWALALPIILSTMFMFMFANLDEASTIDPIPTAVINDEAYRQAAAFSTTIEALGETGSDQLLDVRLFDSSEKAQKALTSGEVVGVISVDGKGTPSLSVTATTSINTNADQIKRTILKTVVETYERNAALLADIAESNPLALADADAVARAFEQGTLTEEISLTHNAPKGTVRYYYALLGMAALFSAQVGLMAICITQPNLSALGARRALGATSRSATLAATLAASWLLSFVCLLVAFAYILVVVGMSFDGREGLCVAALAVASLFATSLGTLLGSIPKVDMGGKGGILTGMTCLLSLFAGLYGEPCMELADSIARNAPVLAALNPAKVVTDTFYSLYYYDSLAPFLGKVGLLVGMAALLFAVSTLFIRRQRYSSL